MASKDLCRLQSNLKRSRVRRSRLRSNQTLAPQPSVAIPLILRSENLKSPISQRINMDQIIEACANMDESKRKYKKARSNNNDLVWIVYKIERKIDIISGKINYQVSRMAKHPNMSDYRKNHKLKKIRKHKRKIKSLRKRMRTLIAERDESGTQLRLARSEVITLTAIYEDLLAGV